MHISEFDYQLPKELIAQKPLERRDASRMLVLDRRKRAWTDSQFALLPGYLCPNDILVVNNTRVFPARLVGQRDPSGGRVEILLVRELEPFVWEALVRPANRLKEGNHVRFGNSELQCTVIRADGETLRVLRFEFEGQFEYLLDRLGEAPLPPYIKRHDGPSPEDRERYQTVYAHSQGAIAAPTAGLHFSHGLIEEIRARGIEIVEITLHVGYGTFEPVRAPQVKDHRVSPERFEISSAAATAINSCRRAGGRVIAVGTTTTRTLESANATGRLEAGAGTAELTIIPGFRFRVTDALLTNFHLPRSSLLLLVCAFADRELVLQAYQHAVESHYRFYSYGDCMLII
jgi:S-adenosylmethionine:tRNA ribosyltransferase-isomerase